MRRLLTLRWIAGHLLALGGVVAFVIFGFWQLDRHDQKRVIKDGVEAAAELPPIALEDAAGVDLTYRMVVATGEYDPGTEVLVFRSRRGVSGYDVLMPLQLVDGAAILVDRGWVPLEYDRPTVAVPGPTQGVVQATGQIWPSSSGSIPAELPAVMKQVDTGVIDAFTAYGLMEPYLILQDQDPPVRGELPVIVDPPQVSLGPHLGYAGQWFLFALVVLVGYPVLLRRTLRP